MRPNYVILFSKFCIIPLKIWLTLKINTSLCHKQGPYLHRPQLVETIFSTLTANTVIHTNTFNLLHGTFSPGRLDFYCFCVKRVALPDRWLLPLWLRPLVCREVVRDKGDREVGTGTKVGSKSKIS